MDWHRPIFDKRSRSDHPNYSQYKMRPNPSVPQFTSVLGRPLPRQQTTPVASGLLPLASQPSSPSPCSDPAELRLGPSCVRGPCGLRELHCRLHGSSLSALSCSVLESGRRGRWRGRPWSSPLGRPARSPPQSTAPSCR